MRPGILERLGVEFRYNTQIGKDITLSQIFEQGYKAIFIGVGTEPIPPLGLKERIKAIKDSFLASSTFLKSILE